MADIKMTSLDAAWALPITSNCTLHALTNRVIICPDNFNGLIKLCQAPLLQKCDDILVVITIGNRL
jgi:hypothetical protein